MGRSKFPGKPSKHCHRKRINVLPQTGELNQEIDSSLITDVGSSKENKQDEDINENDSESTSQLSKARPLRRSLSRKLSTNLRKNGCQRAFISKIRSKHGLKNGRAGRKILTKKHICKDSTNFAGKFVLPSRSVHSSRVIKPNKRFIDLNDSFSVKKKVLTKRSLKISESGQHMVETDSKDKLAFSNGHRVILRQARLKLPIQIGSQGPFSSNLHNGPGTIICGVCGAVRYYRFVKQARKFNIYSCESCRKFITKQIKRQNIGTLNSNVLVCLSGQGLCYVPPAERSQQWKISKCAYRSRCPACWLKMCLKAYHLPLGLKNNLTQLLPRNMRTFDFTFSNSLPPILWQKNVDRAAESIEESLKQRPVRLKPVDKPPQNSTTVASDVKRQKIDLKGPRVKHVCRSASIVLGQPLATFASEASDKKISNEPVEIGVDRVKTNSEYSNDFFKASSPSVVDEECASNSGSCKSYSEKHILPNKDRTRCFPKSSINEDTESPPPAPEGILYNYPHELNFENRYQSGFSLMDTVDIMNPLCFVCGSAGKDQMVFCLLCCEPYHYFCAETPITSKNDWVCMKCTVCHICKGTERSKRSCPRCLRIFHNECFSNKEDLNGSKQICRECMKCSECGASTAYNLSNFPGNTPLCITCLDKRKLGMYCPICQSSFEENPCESKMLECYRCKKWVHAKCEKLTSEQYDVLKLLPLSSSFQCSQCPKDSTFLWQESVHKELFRSFKHIFRLLTKNRSARIILKRIARSSYNRSMDHDNNNCSKDIEKIYCFDENTDELPVTMSNVTLDKHNLIAIKNGLCDYNSVKIFNNDMLEALKCYNSDQLLLIYKNIFQCVFPWFNQAHEIDSSVLMTKSFTKRIVYTDIKKSPQLSSISTIDSRKCEFCHIVGDCLEKNEGRLLFCGQNRWVHINCALWSNNVQEQVDDHLQNVIDTIDSTSHIDCTVCNKNGASIQCHTCKSCSYHFMCARKADFCFTRIKKATFCSKHRPEDSQFILKDDEYENSQGVFIEQHPKEVIRSDPEKVNCSIGSLYIHSLGKVEPVVSDTQDAIIPTGFMCSRVFWSTKDPWKLVSYTITTSILNPNCTTLTVDKNITVDHSLEKFLVEKAMKELNDWRKFYDKKSDEVDSEDEEEKNSILSPELTDTILEDLPHDILDGISVQDIFPNFSYEDMLGFDNSNTESISEFYKNEDSTIDTSEFKTSNTREWMRTRSDTSIKTRIPPLSLTLSYKVDSAQPKKRKISTETPINNLLLLQVDGAFDEDSSSECDDPIESDAVNAWGISEEPVTCEKCQCTYRTQASYKRHLDTCEVLCTSESDSENITEQDNFLMSRSAIVGSEAVEVPVRVNEPTSQPIVFHSYETYQSQVHTSVLNVVPETTATHQVPPQPTITMQEPAPISVSVPFYVQPSITPQIVQPSIDFQQSQTQPLTMQQVLMQRPPRRDPVVLQQIQPAPTPGFVPFVDAFGQAQTNQSVQYVQIAPHVQPAPTQLLQIRTDGNGWILPSIQPATVIVQQPQQLVLDSSGTFGWTQQTQPQIIYGFETIVQNTVMQSQQFIPTPVPGVLAANSSYSSTTQVFQTSKLEPVLDVSTNSFVLVNPTNQLDLQSSQFPQNHTVMTSQTPSVIYSSQSSVQKPIVTTTQNCISLPTSPFVSNQNVPVNAVPPIQKPPTSHARPMSRVLPMPTNTVRTNKKIMDTTKSFPEIDKPNPAMFEDKFNFSKDAAKAIDLPKSKNKRLDILDYKVAKVIPKIENHQILKMEEKRFKEMEPLENHLRLSTYEPLKEIAKVRLDMFEKSNKPIDIFDNEKFFKSEQQKCASKFDNLKVPNKKFSHFSDKNRKEDTHLDKYQTLKESSRIVNDSHKIETKINGQIKNSSPKLENIANNSDSPGVKIETILYKNPKLECSIIDDIESDSYQNDKFETMPLKKETDQRIEVPVRQTPDIKHNFIVSKDKSEDCTPHKQFDMPKLSENLVAPDVKLQVEPRLPIKTNFELIPSMIVTKLQKKETSIRVDQEVQSVVRNKYLEKTRPSEEKPNMSGSNKPTKKDNDISGPSIVYTIENKEEGFKYKSTSIPECWSRVLAAVQTARAEHNMPPLPVDCKQMKSVQITGLKCSNVKYLIEQLPGASKCVKYKPVFKFTPYSQDSSEACLHGFGSIRCKPHSSKNAEPYDMFSWLSSKHREPFTSLDALSGQSRRINNFPMAMKFKNLKLTSRYSVGVYRSLIHGKGLFCLRDIEPGEMVIEYAGEVIRSILTDKREKYYNSKGIGCYMFRVDDNLVVDATMKGNAARFINHSCDPNCYSKVVEIIGHKHIIIFALRRIYSGEELTYDYKFPFEEDKIPCTCGAKRCRKFLN